METWVVYRCYTAWQQTQEINVSLLQYFEVDLMILIIRTFLKGPQGHHEVIQKMKPQLL